MYSPYHYRAVTFHIICYNIIYFFFFQAEDGIRDTSVTGVQTCALPICRAALQFRRLQSSAAKPAKPQPRSAAFRPLRSEERRVGKECRSGWAACHGYKITK